MFFIHGIDEDLIVTEELAQVEGLLETTHGQDIYQAFLNMITNLDLPLEKLSWLTTDGAPSMIGNKSGFVSLVLAKQKELNHQSVHTPSPVSTSTVQQNSQPGPCNESCCQNCGLHQSKRS